MTNVIGAGGGGGGGGDPFSSLFDTSGGDLTGGLLNPIGAMGGFGGIGNALGGGMDIFSPFATGGLGGGNAFTSSFDGTSGGFTDPAANLGGQTQTGDGGTSTSPPETFPQQQMTQTQAQPLTQSTDIETQFGRTPPGPTGIQGQAAAAGQGLAPPANQLSPQDTQAAQQAADQSAALGIPPAAVQPTVGRNPYTSFPGVQGAPAYAAPAPAAAGTGNQLGPADYQGGPGDQPYFQVQGGRGGAQYPAYRGPSSPAEGAGVESGTAATSPYAPGGPSGGPSLPRQIGTGAGRGGPIDTGDEQIRTGENAPVAGAAAPGAGGPAASGGQLGNQFQNILGEFARQLGLDLPGLMNMLPAPLRQMLQQFQQALGQGGQAQAGQGQGAGDVGPDQGPQPTQAPPTQRGAPGMYRGESVAPGQVINGWRFNGGNPNNPSSWTRAGATRTDDGGDGGDSGGPPYTLPADRPRPSDITGPGDTAATRGVAHPLPPDRPVPSEITGPGDVRGPQPGDAQRVARGETVTGNVPVAEPSGTDIPTSDTARAEPSPAPPSRPGRVPQAPAAAGTAPRGQASPSAVNFIARQEGFRPTSYGDYHQYSIGYGTRARGPGQTITRAEARQALQREANNAARAVDRIVPPNTPQNVRDALTSFTYNTGTKWMGGRLGQAVRAGNWRAAAQIMQQYVHAGGRVNAGLIRRRREEARLMLQGGGQVAAQ